MNYTQNCTLPQWEGADRVLREDFNAAMNTIDTKLGETARALAVRGNCEIVCGTYTGTNEVTGPELFFEKVPLIVFITGRGRGVYAIRDGGAIGVEGGYNGFDISASWGETSVQFTGSSVHTAMNQGSQNYSYVALLQA